jgi:hypothetical protein
MGWLVVLVWLLIGLVMARRWFARIRPWTKPLNCQHTHFSNRHDSICYRRWGDVDTRGEAVFFSALISLLGPLFPVGLLLGKVITSGDRMLPEERDATDLRTRALERGKR